jgi:hypothetical protein
MSKARELAELSRTVADSADAVAITVDSNENTTFTGVVTANAGVVVDNITIDGTTIALSSGILTLDVAGDIRLDAGGGNIQLIKGGTEFGRFFEAGTNDFYIYNPNSDKDIIVYGNDSGTSFEAVRFDMSNAGAATFNAGATFGSGIDVTGSVTADGLTVDTNTLVVDATNNRVGIGTSSPTTALDVRGGINSAHATFTGQASRGLVISTANTLSNDDGVVYNAQTAGSGKHIFQTAGTTKASITANGLEFPDNTKAIFGAGSDLQIYHDGSDSWLVDNGTGGLKIGVSGTGTSGFYKGTGSETIATFEPDGAVTLYHNNAVKLATSASGISVTGTVTADGLTVDTNTLVVDATNNRVGIGTSSPRTLLHVTGLTGDDDPALGSSAAPVFISNTANSYGLNIGVNSAGAGWLQAQSNTTSTAYDLLLNPLGGNVGIGTSSPANKLHVAGGKLQITGATGGGAGGGYLSGETATEFHIVSEDYTGAGYADIVFDSGNGSGSSYLERMRIDSSGKLLIGTTHNSLYNSSTQAHAGALIDGLNDNIQVARWEGTPLFVNRMSTDGNLVDFRFDGAPVGGIGNNGDNLGIESVDVGLLFLSGSSQIVPTGGNFGVSDGTKDLGRNTTRFKDLYLSGSAYTPVVQGLGDEAGLTFGGAVVAPRKNNAAANGTVDLGASDARFKDFYLSGTSNVGVGRFTAQSPAHSAATLVLGHEGSSKSQIRATVLMQEQSDR